MSWTTIRYRDFYDVPRIFLTTHDGKQYLFDCPFDDQLDEYLERYRVYELPGVPEEELQGSWVRLPERAVSLVGEVPVASLQFDPTKRNSINTITLDELVAHQSPQNILVA